MKGPGGVGHLTGVIADLGGNSVLVGAAAGETAGAGADLIIINGQVRGGQFTAGFAAYSPIPGEVHAGTSTSAVVPTTVQSWNRLKMFWPLIPAFAMCEAWMADINAPAHLAKQLREQGLPPPAHLPPMQMPPLGPPIGPWPGSPIWLP